MKVKKSIVLLLGLLITSCNTITPLYNEKINNENKEFSVKLVSSSYMKNKLQSFIDLGNNPARNSEAQKRIVRDINFYALEDQKNGNNYYKNLYHAIKTVTPSINSSIISMNQVIAKRSIDPIFDAFLTSTVLGEIPVTSSRSASNPKMAMDSNGNFIVTFMSSDGNNYGIYAQRYNSNGVAQGSDFRVNDETGGYQAEQSIAIDSQNNFVITWRTQYGENNGLSDVYAKRYNSNGVVQGTEFRVNTYTTGDQFDPDMAMDNNGNFVITWTSNQQDESYTGIYAQRYNSNGVAQGSEFRVNDITQSRQMQPKVSMNSSGNFAITWMNQNYVHLPSVDGIYAKRYDSNGVVQGSEFRVNTNTSYRTQNPDIDINNNGNFVVSWIGSDIYGIGVYPTQDGSGDGVFAQRYDSNGIVQGSEFKVNTYTEGNQHKSSVEIDNNGNFIIVWISDIQDSVYSQRYNSLGFAQGSESKINTNTNVGNDGFPSTISMNNTGNYIITFSAGGIMKAKIFDFNGDPR